MKYQAVNKYDHTNTCGHMHNTETAAQKCCDKTFAHNVGSVKEVWSEQENVEYKNLPHDEDAEGLKKYAAAFARKGGQAKSPAKTAAARKNAKKGGRQRAEYKLFWVSEDKQSSISGGIFKSKKTAISGIDNFRKEMLSVSDDEESVTQIKSGNFEVNKVKP